MENVTRQLDSLVAVLQSQDKVFVTKLSKVVWRILATLKAFSRNKVTPRSFELCERRLERHFRELARLVLESTANQIESLDKPKPIT